MGKDQPRPKNRKYGSFLFKAVKSRFQLKKRNKDNLSRFFYNRFFQFTKLHPHFGFFVKVEKSGVLFFGGATLILKTLLQISYAR